MKRFLLSLVLLLVVITVSAQIQRTFLGCTLGVSTKAFVKNAMTKKGYRLKRIDENEKYVYQNVKFIEYTCKEVCFSFYAGKLLSIDFFMESQINNNYRNLPELEFKELRSILDAKYSAYKEDEQFYDDYVSNWYCRYWDVNTYINLQIYNRFSVERLLGLSYIDLGLVKKRKQDSSDEI